MMWIATLCLLAIAAWLFFNAWNERQWVQDHSHDETVASDEGLLPSFTALTRSALPEGGTSNTTERLGEIAREANSAMGRMASKVGEHAGRLDERLDARNRVSKVADRVTTGVGQVEQQVKQRIAAARSGGDPAAPSSSHTPPANPDKSSAAHGKDAENPAGGSVKSGQDL
ncbi:MAG: hypothetical protein HKN42_13795 [Granulosicoccus sp.]|nr:hypothetical protein [Granulosicoccus sp.]